MLGQVFRYWNHKGEQCFGIFSTLLNIGSLGGSTVEELAEEFGEACYRAQPNLELEGELFWYTVPNIPMKEFAGIVQVVTLREPERRRFRVAFREAYSEARKEAGIRGIYRFF